MVERLSINEDLLAKRLLDLVRDEDIATVYVENYEYVYIRDQDGEGNAEELVLVEGFTFASDAEVSAIAELVLRPMIITGVGLYDMVAKAYGWEADLLVPNGDQEPLRVRANIGWAMHGMPATIHIQKYGSGRDT